MNSQFSLTWDAHKLNISNGLSSLQQSGEFVDMTLAADGHLVKVHQLVMALASPYIKELISSANCPHPVIFLNKISYPILRSILEYVYTGEALIDKDYLNQFIDASKELHIKGLENMKLVLSTSGSISNLVSEQQPNAKQDKSQDHSITQQFTRTTENIVSKSDPENKQIEETAPDDNGLGESHVVDFSFDDAMETDTDRDYESWTVEANDRQSNQFVTSKNNEPRVEIQYTLSNQGALQMILNRYIYFLRYSGRKPSERRHRNWRCVNYIRTRCPANVITEDEVVVRRNAAHTHPFHDKQILKRVRDNLVFSTLCDAEVIGQTKKDSKLTKSTSEIKDSRSKSKSGDATVTDTE